MLFSISKIKAELWKKGILTFYYYYYCQTFYFFIYIVHCFVSFYNWYFSTKLFEGHIVQRCLSLVFPLSAGVALRQITIDSALYWQIHVSIIALLLCALTTPTVYVTPLFWSQHMGIRADSCARRHRWCGSERVPPQRS